MPLLHNIIPILSGLNACGTIAEDDDGDDGAAANTGEEEEEEEPVSIVAPPFASFVLLDDIDSGDDGAAAMLERMELVVVAWLVMNKYPNSTIRTYVTNELTPMYKSGAFTSCLPLLYVTPPATCSGIRSQFLCVNGNNIVFILLITYRVSISK